MASTMVNNVHDALFKDTFSQVEHARGEIRRLLPPALARRVAFRSLALRPASFIDPAFASRHSDLLYTVRLSGRRAFIYILFEHQSTSDPLMPFRLLVYVVRIWEAHLKKHPRQKRLPAIVPMVLHHSKRGWAAPVSLDALYDLDAGALDAVASYLPQFHFLLDDLSKESDASLRTRAMSALGRVVLWCLKHSQSPEHLLADLDAWAETVEEVLAAPNGTAALARVLRYIWSVHGEVDAGELEDLVVQKLGQKAKEAAVTIADQLRREGHKEGLQKGLQKGKKDTLLAQLGAKFGKVPRAVVVKVNAASTAEIDRWIKRILTADSLAELMGG
ncbi:MAG: Rpn family recombination-promoting nuclease/putative transposase [Byssovorax sp.]